MLLRSGSDFFMPGSICPTHGVILGNGKECRTGIFLELASDKQLQTV